MKPAMKKLACKRTDWMGAEDVEFSITDLLISVANNSRVGLFFCDDELHCMFTNQALANMDGLPPEAHLGKTPREFLGEAAGSIEPRLNEVLVTGRPLFNLELNATLPGKSVVKYWFVTCFPIRNRRERVGGVAAVVIEITDEKKQQGLLAGQLRRIDGMRQVADGRPGAEVHGLPKPGSGLLRSWKDIANSLAASVRTVQRWERNYELPIHRISGDRGASVFAFSNELQYWLQTRSWLSDRNGLPPTSGTQGLQLD